MISHEDEENWIARTLLASVMPDALGSLRRCSPPGPDFLFDGLIDPIGLEVTTLRGGADASGRPLAAAEPARGFGPTDVPASRAQSNFSVQPTPEDGRG